MNVTAPVRPLRTLLVLGRVSNVPTVWSNCLAAWLLNGGTAWPHFAALCCGATLIYVGGMFLNDAFDADFDRRFRRERPIPAGEIATRTVAVLGGGLLAAGGLVLSLPGVSVAIGALLLVAAVVLYNVVHKRTVFAPVLMALCRFLLCVTAGLAALQPLHRSVIAHGLALAVYVTGLSYFARGESKPGTLRAWPMALLFAPFVVNALVSLPRHATSWIASAVLLVWLGWCLRGLWRRPTPVVGRAVSGLLAGIVLVDAAALPRLEAGLAGAFAGCFGLALLLQRRIPAT